MNKKLALVAAVATLAIGGLAIAQTSSSSGSPAGMSGSTSASGSTGQTTGTSADMGQTGSTRSTGAGSSMGSGSSPGANQYGTDASAQTSGMGADTSTAGERG